MLMLNVWPFVIIAILVAPDTLSHRQDSVDKRYSNATKEFRSKFNARPQEVSQEVSKRAVKPVVAAAKVFTNRVLVLKDTQTIFKKSIGSDLIQRMVKGTLPKELYDELQKQDAHYLFFGRNILQETSKTIKDKYPEFADIYNIYAGKYDEYYQMLLNELDIKDVSQVKVGSATAEYEEFLAELSQKHPRRLAIGFLPCSQFLRVISGEVVEEAKDSPYEQFFLKYVRQPGYQSDLEKFINKKVSEGVFTDEDIAIYLQGMKNEENFIENVPGL